MGLGGWLSGPLPSSPLLPPRASPLPPLSSLSCLSLARTTHALGAFQGLCAALTALLGQAPGCRVPPGLQVTFLPLSCLVI